MASPICIWTSAAHHTSFRCGGWAYVRSDGGQLIGAAGGERSTTARRMEVAGLAASLRELPKSKARIIVYTTSEELARCAKLLTGGTADDGAAPSEDLGLWAQILTRIAGREVELIRLPTQSKTPAEFVTAWAHLARDKVKATGPFTASIPKPNLAKVRGLGAK